MLPTLYYIVLAGIIGMIGFYLLGISDPLTKS
jgi:lactate permease